MRRGDGNPVRHCSLHRMRDVDGVDAVQVVQDGSKGLQQEDLQRDNRVHPAHEDDARMQERDKTKT